MKKKFFIIILICLLLVGVFFIGRQVGINEQESSTSTITKTEEVSKQDIKKTLTASSSVSAKTTEKLTLTTTKYFKAMCVEEDDSVKAGENILEYTDGTYLTATANCVIKSISVPDSGSKCTSSNYIEVYDTDTLVATISINESEISNVKVGQEVEITLSSDESKTYTGTITKVDEIGTYQSSGSTFSATVEFTNDGNVKLGMGVSCTIILQEEKDVLSVPIDAVKENSEGKEYVEKVNDDGETEETIVETGISDDNYVQITSGLSEGDKVQIETEITQDSNSSSNNNSKGMNGGGQMPGGDQGGSQDRGQMPSGDQGGGSMGAPSSN